LTSASAARRGSRAAKGQQPARDLGPATFNVARRADPLRDVRDRLRGLGRRNRLRARRRAKSEVARSRRVHKPPKSS
jgi:hypothetical protein